jgi:hypothetical protein
VADELTPGEATAFSGWAEPGLDEELADAGRRKLDPEPGELCGDPPVTPRYRNEMTNGDSPRLD